MKGELVLCEIRASEGRTGGAILSLFTEFDCK